MSYAVKDDIEQIHGTDMLERVADRDGDGELDTDAVDLALESASSEIDSYISVRYTTPLAAPPPIIKQYCVDIALYRLASSSTRVTEEMRQRYEDAIDWLKAVSKGDAAIDVGGDDDDGDDNDGADTVGAVHSAGMFYSTRG